MTEIIKSNDYYKLKFCTNYNLILKNITESEFQFAAFTKNLISLKFLCENIFNKLNWCKKSTNVCEIFKNYVKDVETLKYMKSLGFLFSINLMAKYICNLECISFLLKQENIKNYYNLNPYDFFKIMIF